MFKTQITEMLGIKYPIFCGSMMNISKPEFVAECSNAGALGILASVMYRKPEPLRTALKQLFSLTKNPFAVNLNLFPMLMPVKQIDLIKAMIDEGVKIIETSGHQIPDEYIPLFKEHDIIWIHKCAGVRYAQKAQSLGANIVEIVGYENGGAVGNFDIGTFVLTPATVSALNVPVVGGGGIVDGKGLVAILSLGAQAGLMGTRLLLTKECPIHDNLKQALLHTSVYDTTLVLKSLNAAHRIWNNEGAKRVLKLEESKGSQAEILSEATGAKSLLMYEKGDITAGIVSCGQGIGLCKDIPTVKNLIEKIMNEAKEIVQRLYNS
ncbi:MAG TPA: nitronate monooxygenase family protein [Candidatus Lokiarchaeia archaeon]